MTVHLRPNSIHPLTGFIVGIVTGSFASAALNVPFTSECLKGFAIGIFCGAGVLAIIIMGLLIVSFGKKEIR